MSAERSPVHIVTPTEVLLPSDQRHPGIHIHYHYSPQPVVYQQSQSDDWSKPLVAILSIAAAVVGLIAAITNAAPSRGQSLAYSQPTSDSRYYPRDSSYYEQPVQMQPQWHCWSEPRREYLGRFITHVEVFQVPNGYGGWRQVRREHYVDRHRNYNVIVCS